MVNKAYRTLSSPIKRAEYILELKGITIPEDNDAVDKEFFAEIMKRNEEMVCGLANKGIKLTTIICILWNKVDETNKSAELKGLLRRLIDDKDKCFCDFESHLKSEEFSAAKASLVLLRYYLRIETSIKKKIFELDVIRV